jgi:putative phosphoribosyl transferase
MYFASRMQAGRVLASKLVDKYRYENCAVVAVDDGGIVIGAQIAMQLHCVLNFIDSVQIKLPQEPVAIAGLTTGGYLAYNPKYSSGELEDILMENRGVIEEEKLKQMHHLNSLNGGGATVDKKLLKGHNVILVSEGLSSAFPIDLALEFLKPVNLESLIFATPFATVSAVDKMHISGDAIYCLSVLEEIRDVDHYYDKRDIPEHIRLMEIVSQIILNWR